MKSFGAGYRGRAGPCSVVSFCLENTPAKNAAEEQNYSCMGEKPTAMKTASAASEVRKAR